MNSKKIDVKAVEREIKRFKFDMMKKLPFYGDILLRFPIVPDDSVPTAATNGRRISYSPAFFAKLTNSERNFIIMHEVFHIMLMHPKRRGNRDPRCWNIACDLMVNRMLEKLMHNMQHAGIPFSRPREGIFGMVSMENFVEDIYEQVLRDNEGLDHSKGEYRVVFKIFGAMSEGERIIPAPDDLVIIAAGDSFQDDLDEQLILKIIREAAQKNRGNMGSYFVPEQALKLVETKKLDWRALLRDLLEEEQSEDSSYATPERKYIHMDLILPGHCLDQTAPGELWAFVDSSGSIGQNELNQFLTQLYRLSKEFACEINLAYWDTKVTDVYRGIKDEKALLAALPRHSGGTDINCVYDFLSEKNISPDIMVILTDGYFGALSTSNFKRSYGRKTVLVLSGDIEADAEMKLIGKTARI